MAPPGPMAWDTLVQAPALAAALGRADLVVLDCRHVLAAAGSGPVDAGRQAWQAGHIPGARHVHLDVDLSAPHRAPGQGRHPWPDAAMLCDRLSRWGVTPAHQVVAYDDADGAFAARVWYALRLLGHRHVAVLDGGWRHWQALALPVDSSPAPVQAAPGAWQGRQFDRARLLDAAGVQAGLRAGAVLLDARAGPRFRGEMEPIDPVAGHVPGAVNRPYVQNLGDDGLFLPATQLHAVFSPLLAGRPPQALIAMCGSGVTACHHLLAMTHAGLPGGRLYTGSWSGWIEDPARPVATGAA